MKPSQLLTLPVILTFVLSCATTFADGYVLVSEEDVARSIAAEGIDEVAERAADPLGPKIDVVSPGDGNEFVSPVDIHITFVPTEEAAFALDKIFSETRNREIPGTGLEPARAKPTRS